MLPCNEDVKREDETAIGLYRIGLIGSSVFAKHFQNPVNIISNVN